MRTEVISRLDQCNQPAGKIASGGALLLEIGMGQEEEIYQNRCRRLLPWAQD